MTILSLKNTTKKSMVPLINTIIPRIQYCGAIPLLIQLWPQKGGLFSYEQVLYLSKKCLEKINQRRGRKAPFRDKILLAQNILNKESSYLTSKNISKQRIWVLNDCWFTSERYCSTITDLEHYFVCGIKKDRRIRLFGKRIRVDLYFEKYQKKRYFTFKDENRKIYYKTATLDVSKIGRCKVFAFKTTKADRYKYYISNKIDLTPKCAYKHFQCRWSVENMHRSVKQYFGLNSCYFRKKETLLSHYNLSYILYWIFSIYLQELNKLGFITTIEDLWHEYITESNFIRYNGKNYSMIDNLIQEKGFS